MRSLGAVASMIHSMIKFPTANGTATMVTSEVTLRECRRNKEARGSTQEGRMTHPRIRASDPNETSTEKMCAPKEDSTKRKPPEEASKEDKPPLEKVLISDDYPYEPITIGGNLSAECRLELIKTLWVANPVLVKKAVGSSRMCIDFKDLNKACPKDLYLLPEIDWTIESLMRPNKAEQRGGYGAHVKVKRVEKKKERCQSVRAIEKEGQIGGGLVKLSYLARVRLPVRIAIKGTLLDIEYSEDSAPCGVKKQEGAVGMREDGGWRLDANYQALLPGGRGLYLGGDGATVAQNPAPVRTYQLRGESNMLIGGAGGLEYVSLFYVVNERCRGSGWVVVTPVAAGRRLLKGMSVACVVLLGASLFTQFGTTSMIPTVRTFVALFGLNNLRWSGMMRLGLEWGFRLGCCVGPVGLLACRGYDCGHWDTPSLACIVLGERQSGKGARPFCVSLLLFDGASSGCLHVLAWEKHDAVYNRDPNPLRLGCVGTRMGEVLHGLQVYERGQGGDNTGNQMCEEGFVTMSEYLRLPFLSEMTIEAGEALTKQNVIPQHTTTPLSADEQVPEKTDSQQRVEASDPKIVATRIRKANAASKRKAEKNRESKGASGSEGSSKRRKPSSGPGEGDKEKSSDH
ncbi:hypothetical protein Tco_0227120, partial [Tanacetum coccineum]